MEIYYCLNCYHRFTHPHPRMVTCSKCECVYVFWETSPYEQIGKDEWLPQQVKDQIAQHKAIAAGIEPTS